MKRNKYYTFRIYPDKEQEVLLNKTFGCVRFIYNKMLESALDNKNSKLVIPTPASFKEEFEFLKEVDSQTLDQTKQDLKQAVSLLYEYESDIKPIELTNSKQVLGLDFSMPQLYVDSNGDYPIPGSNEMYKKYIKQLQKEQKKMSKRYEVAKLKGKELNDSKNYQKQRMKVAKIHEKITNCRKDFLHKETTAISKQYDFVAIEDLSMKGMAKALNFSKSVSDNSWGAFTILLSQKLENKGGKLVKIAKSHPSSKMCSTCGNVKNKLSLSERTYSCEGCKTVIDRDLNAALNIKKEGIRILLT